MFEFWSEFANFAKAPQQKMDAPNQRGTVPEL